MEDNRHRNNTSEEAVLFQSLTWELFVIVLEFCQVTNATELWEDYKESMTSDTFRQARNGFSDLEIYNSSEIINEDLIIKFGW